MDAVKAIAQLNLTQLLTAHIRVAVNELDSSKRRKGQCVVCLCDVEGKDLSVVFFRTGGAEKCHVVHGDVCFEQFMRNVSQEPEAVDHFE